MEHEKYRMANGHAYGYIITYLFLKKKIVVCCKCVVKRGLVNVFHWYYIHGCFLLSYFTSGLDFT